jgi:hypothetical protein
VIRDHADLPQHAHKIVKKILFRDLAVGSWRKRHLARESKAQTLANAGTGDCELFLPNPRRLQKRGRHSPQLKSETTHLSRLPIFLPDIVTVKGGVICLHDCTVFVRLHRALGLRADLAY